MGEILTPGHDKWNEFREKMWDSTELCSHTTKGARAILQTFEGVDVEGTLDHFKTMGGYCDCEIRLNVCF